MQKYIMAMALALVLGAAAFTSAQAVENSAPRDRATMAVGAVGFIPDQANPSGLVPPGRGADRVNPGLIRARWEAFKDYSANNNQLSDKVNLAAMGLTDKSELIAIFTNATKISEARKKFICGLQGFDMNKTDFARYDFWGLGFPSAERLRIFTQGYINYVFGERFDPGFADPRSDFIFYSAKEQEILRQDIFGVR